MADSDRNIRLYHYDASPFSRKIVWYLELRQLQYAEVKQPFVLPRPDVEAIGVAYRRMPFMAIGKDIYCDTRIMLRKLEELFPEGKIGATTPEGRTIQKLLDVWHNEAGLFMKGVQCLPSAFFKNEKFAKDRQEFTGRPFNASVMEKLRPEALTYVRNAFSVLEDLLSDDREWLLNTKKPSLCDVEGVFIVEWVANTKGSLPADLVSDSIFPKTYAWIKRFHEAIKAAKSTAPEVTSLKGKEAAEQILNAGFAEAKTGVDSSHAQGLFKEGDEVELFPTDTGFSHRDKGSLVGLTEDEVVVSLRNGLRLHTPRIGYKLQQTRPKI